jgi:hypothetical protein
MKVSAKMVSKKLSDKQKICSYLSARLEEPNLLGGGGNSDWWKDLAFQYNLQTKYKPSMGKFSLSAETEKHLHVKIKH